MESLRESGFKIMVKSSTMKGNCVGVRVRIKFLHSFCNCCGVIFQYGEMSPSLSNISIKKYLYDMAVGKGYSMV